MSVGIHELLAPWEEILENRKVSYGYGTAGFRARYTEDLHPLFVTVGMIAALRSLSLGGKCVGVMVTASHNEEHDNGVKIVDFDGGMLVKEWESISEQWVNDRLDRAVEKITTKLQQLSTTFPDTRPVVMIGMDTRPHSPLLSDFVRRGVEAIRNGIALNAGEMITPLLHFSVHTYNSGILITDPSSFRRELFVDHYNQTLLNGFHKLIQTGTSSTFLPAKVTLDTANGVGSITMSEFLQFASKQGQSLGNWTIDILNLAREGPVNQDCGAEHAQKLQLPPGGFRPEIHADDLLSSFDGDGDRIVFHYFSTPSSGSATNPGWTLLDGDRIACLLSSFLHRSLVESGLDKTVVMGIVQTAYANGASSGYLRSLGVPVVLAKTGVKYLHHKAQALDVGVYFEANGHGTVLFSEKFRHLLSESISALPDSSDSKKSVALQRLAAMVQLINPTVGDALSDLLCTLAVLSVRLKFSILTVDI